MRTGFWAKSLVWLCVESGYVAGQGVRCEVLQRDQHSNSAARPVMHARTTPPTLPGKIYLDPCVWALVWLLWIATAKYTVLL